MTECLSLGRGGVVRTLMISRRIATPTPSSAAPGDGSVESRWALRRRACSWREEEGSLAISDFGRLGREGRLRISLFLHRFRQRV